MPQTVCSPKRLLYRTGNCPDCRLNLPVIEKENYIDGIFVDLSKRFGTIGIKNLLKTSKIVELWNY